MANKLPLSVLLSQVLVAFTIEFDNEFERQMPHSTTWGPATNSRRGPWLVSLAMWSNFMQFVDEEGVPLHRLEDWARITNLGGLERWGYVVVEPDRADNRSKVPRSDMIVRATPAGRRAQDLWRPLAGKIEARWLARFGNVEIDNLREELRALVGQFETELPYYLPVLRYAGGMFTELPQNESWASREKEGNATVWPDLSVLLSQVLLAFTIEFERESKISLAVCANTLRVLNEDGVPVRDIPAMTGISKEAVSASLGFLQKSGYAAIELDPPHPCRIERAGCVSTAQ